MLEQARDFAAECSSLNELLSGLPDARWDEPTQFKEWTANDIIGHLHIFDYAANLTLDSTDAVREFFAASRAGRSETWTLRDFTRQWLGGTGGSALRDRWYRFALQLAARYELEDPVRRVAWGGPDMSTRSCKIGRAHV